MSSTDPEPPQDPRTLDYFRPPPPRPPPTPARLDRRERVAALWVLGLVVGGSFTCAAIGLWALVRRN